MVIVFAQKNSQKNIPKKFVNYLMLERTSLGALKLDSTVSVDSTYVLRGFNSPQDYNLEIAGHLRNLLRDPKT